MLGSVLDMKPALKKKIIILRSRARYTGGEESKGRETEETISVLGIRQ